MIEHHALARHCAPPPADWVVVVLSGELGFGSTDALGVLDRAVLDNPGARVLVDLGNVTFLDSTALVAFARARSRAEAAGGTLSLHAASSFAHRLLEIWHLEPVREVDDALAHRLPRAGPPSRLALVSSSGVTTRFRSHEHRAAQEGPS